MVFRLFLCLTLIPIFELYLLIVVHTELSVYIGSQKAWLVTLGGIFLTGALGTVLLKSQWREAIHGLKAQGLQPEIGKRVGEVVLLAVAAVLLITPGYLSDLVGFSLLVPKVRRGLAGKLAGFVHIVGGSPAEARRSHGSGDIIDVEAEEL